MRPFRRVDGRDHTTACGLFSVLVWSTSNACTRMLSENWGPFLTAGAVGLLGGTVGVLVDLREGNWKRIAKAPVAYWLVCLPLYLLYRLCAILSISVAATREAALVAGLFLDLWPLMTLLSVLIVFRQRPNRQICAGAFLCFFGAILANLDFGMFVSGQAVAKASTALPAFLALSSSLCWGLCSAFVRKLSGGIDGSSVFILLSGVLSMALVENSSEAYQTFSVWEGIELLYLSVVVLLFGMKCWNAAMYRGNCMLIVFLSNFIPIFSVFLSAAVLGVSISVQMVAGAAMIALGTICGHRGAPKELT